MGVRTPSWLWCDCCRRQLFHYSEGCQHLERILGRVSKCQNRCSEQDLGDGHGRALCSPSSRFHIWQDRGYKGEPSETLYQSVSDGNELQKIWTWFHNHSTHPYRQLIRFTRRWSGRNTFHHENMARVTELTQQISGGVPGSQAFLGALQDAASQLWKMLSTEEQAKYRELAKE